MVGFRITFIKNGVIVSYLTHNKNFNRHLCFKAYSQKELINLRRLKDALHKKRKLDLDYIYYLGHKYSITPFLTNDPKGKK